MDTLGPILSVQIMKVTKGVLIFMAGLYDKAPFGTMIKLSICIVSCMHMRYFTVVGNKICSLIKMYNTIIIRHDLHIDYIAN